MVMFNLILYHHSVNLYFNFQELFSDETIRTWFMQSGRKMISDLLIRAERVSYKYYIFKQLEIF